MKWNTFNHPVLKIVHVEPTEYNLVVFSFGHLRGKPLVQIA